MEDGQKKSGFKQNGGHIQKLPEKWVLNKQKVVSQQICALFWKVLVQKVPPGCLCGGIEPPPNYFRKCSCKKHETDEEREQRQRRSEERRVGTEWRARMSAKQPDDSV